MCPRLTDEKLQYLIISFVEIEREGLVFILDCYCGRNVVHNAQLVSMEFTTRQGLTKEDDCLTGLCPMRQSL